MDATSERRVPAHVREGLRSAEAGPPGPVNARWVVSLSQGMIKVIRRSSISTAFVLNFIYRGVLSPVFSGVPVRTPSAVLHNLSELCFKLSVMEKCTGGSSDLLRRRV